MTYIFLSQMAIDFSGNSYIVAITSIIPGSSILVISFRGAPLCFVWNLQGKGDPPPPEKISKEAHFNYIKSTI